MPLAKDCPTQLIDSTSGHYCSTGYRFSPAYSIESPGICIRSTQRHEYCHEVTCPPPPQSKVSPRGKLLRSKPSPFEVIATPTRINTGGTPLYSGHFRWHHIAWCPHYKSSTIGSSCTYNGFSNS